jgi:uncharacterized protein with gpF-like domain
MATDPERAPRNHEAEIAAALLLLGRRYDLPALIRAAKVRPRPFRPIQPTEALRGALARPYLQMLRAWAGEQDAIIAAYRLALTTGDASMVTRQMANSVFAVDAARMAQERQLGLVLEQLERWHRLQWVARIKASTELDVSLFTSPGEVRAEASSAAAWNQQLLGDVHRQVGAGISAALLASLAVHAPAETARADARKAIARARRRSLAIGVDQIDRTSRAFDRARRAAAGLGRFVWRHSKHVKVPRPEHLARDGKIYSHSNAPNDRAGALYGCQCTEEPLWD